MRKRVRLVELDVLRGWAIVLMVIFHICYNLNHFHYIDIDIHQGAFWHSFRNVVVGIFLLCMGISLHLAHGSNIKWASVKKRLLFLVGASLLISLVTYVVFPSSWVYFGILHFIVIATLLGLFFLPYPKLSLIVALFIFIAHFFGHIHLHWLWDFVNTYILVIPQHAVDTVRLIPWFAVVLVGMSMAYYGYHKKLLKTKFFKASLKHNATLAFLGRHALLVYLLHQPILFGLLMLLDL